MVLCFWIIDIVPHVSTEIADSSHKSVTHNARLHRLPASVRLPDVTELVAVRVSRFGTTTLCGHAWKSRVLQQMVKEVMCLSLELEIFRR